MKLLWSVNGMQCAPGSLLYCPRCGRGCRWGVGAWDILTREAERQGWPKAASKGHGIQNKQQVMESRQVKCRTWEIPRCIGAHGVPPGKTQPAHLVPQLPWELHPLEGNCASLLREDWFLFSLKGARVLFMCFSGGSEDIYIQQSSNVHTFELLTIRTRYVSLVAHMTSNYPLCGLQFSLYNFIKLLSHLHTKRYIVSELYWLMLYVDQEKCY